MSIKANVSFQGNITVVSLQGRMDYETQDTLRENILALMRDGKRVVVDMAELNFIGSSGLTNFIHGLAEYSGADNAPLHFCNVKNEIRRIINAYDSKKNLSVHNSRQDALDNFFRAGEGENN